MDPILYLTIKSLAWPAVVGGSVYLLKGPLGDMLRNVKALQVGPVKANMAMMDFLQQSEPIDAAEEPEDMTLERAAPAPKSAEALQDLTAEDPAAAILYVNQEVSRILRQALPGRVSDPQAIAKKLVEEGRISSETSASIQSLDDLADHLQVHPSVKLNANLAEQAVQRAAKLKQILKTQLEESAEPQEDS